MAQREVRIVSRRQGRTVAISTYEPATGREHQTGLTVPLSQEETTIRQLKRDFEKAGLHVSVKEM